MKGTPPFDLELLTQVAAGLTEEVRLAPAERAEVLRIAQGYECKDSAAAAGVSPETIRARRKRIYRRLHVAGASELIASLLSRTLELLANPESLAPPPEGAGDPARGARPRVSRR